MIFSTNPPNLGALKGIEHLDIRDSDMALEREHFESLAVEEMQRRAHGINDALVALLRAAKIGEPCNLRIGRTAYRFTKTKELVERARKAGVDI